MVVRYEETGKLRGIESIIREMDSDTTITGIMVFACHSNHFTSDQLDPILTTCNKPIFGGIFPSVIYDSKKCLTGSVIIGFKVYLHTKIIPNIHEDIGSIESELEAIYPEINNGKTFFINVDGLSDGLESFKEALFYSLGLSKNYIGGGAGNLAFVREPCVITNEGLIQDAAVLALIDINSGIGVSHGWQEVSEPLKVTEVVGNDLVSINWEPAFKVYKEQIKALSGQDITSDNFFNIAKAYPFGISKIGNEMVVRDPIEVIDNKIIRCVGAIPKNTFVYILNGTRESLIDGAKQATLLAKQAFKEVTDLDDEKAYVTLMIDCISRGLFLGEDFQGELDAVGSHVVGALTLGEIANTGKAYLELYNKTSVVGIMEV